MLRRQGTGRTTRGGSNGACIARVAAWCLALGAAAGPAAGEDLFRFDTATTSGPALTSTVRGSDLPELVSDLVRTQGDFGAYFGRDTQATLNYAGMANAFVLDINATGTQATLQFPELGFSRTFNAADPDDLEDEVTDFLFREGEDIYGEFLELVRQQTVVDALDGNPTSVTARLAAGTMRAHVLGPWFAVPTGSDPFGYDPVDGDEGDDARATAGTTPMSRGYANFVGTGINGEDYDGTRFELNGFGEIVGDRFGLSVGAFFAGQEIEDTGMSQLGVDLGLPIRLVPDAPLFDGRARLEVRAVPVFQLGFAGSTDAGAGGAVFGYGGVLGARVTTEHLVFSAGVQSIWYDGIGTGWTIEFNSFGSDDDGDYDDDGFEFDTQLDQQILSAGGSVGWRPADWLLLDAGYAYHDYRKDAGVSYWGTPSVGVNATVGSFMLRAAYEADLADRVDSHSLSFGFVCAF